MAKLFYPVFIFLLFISNNFLKAQTQVGSEINGQVADEISGHGVSLSADGSRIVIGAPSGTGNTAQSGVVRIFNFNGANWVQMGPDINGQNQFDSFGHVVSMSDAGTRFATSAPGFDANGNSSGKAAVFEYNGSAWVQIGADILGEAASDLFGDDLELSADGNRLVVCTPFNEGAVGVPGSGHARVYEYDGNNWVQLGADIDGIASSGNIGRAASISGNGNRIVVGGSGLESPPKGVVQVYEYNGSAWVQIGTDLVGENFGGDIEAYGTEVAISDDGNIIAVGANQQNFTFADHGAVFIYEYSGSAWVQKGTTIYGQKGDDHLGRHYGIALSADGDRLFVSAEDNDDAGVLAGEAYIFDWNGSAWVQFGNDIQGEDPQDRFGFAVAMTPSGSHVAASSIRNDDAGNNTGSVRVYNQILLPVDLINFSAQKIGETVQLTWVTASEINNEGFELQHSTDGQLWQVMDFIKGSGTTNVEKKYSYQDSNPVVGTNYYRLKQVDYDGQFNFSKVATVLVANTSPVVIYPNPTTGKVELIGVDAGELIIRNTIGQVVKQEVLKSNSFDISILEKGIYFIEIKTSNSLITKHIIKN